MKKILSLSLLALTFPAFISCVHKPKDIVSVYEEQDRNLANNTSLKTATCDQLVGRALDPNYILKNLAGLYAQSRQCPGFAFNKANLTDKEKKIFSAGFDLDDTYNTKFKIPRPPELITNREKWAKVWALYKGSNRPAAIAALKNLASSAPDMTEKSRALFFLSKLYKKMNQPEEAQKYLEEAANNDFFSYHALAAHYELGRPLAPITTILSSPTTSFKFNPEMSFLADKDLRMFKALHQNGEYMMLNRTCFAFDKDWADCANMGIYLAEKSAYYNMLHFSFSYVNDAHKRDLFIRYSHLMFPTPHIEKATEMSEKTGTPVSLILAIIKQESSLYPYAVSRAPAYGLMQLIPALAKSLAAKYNVKGYSKAEDLFDADLNMTLGTYELTDQIKLQKGQLTRVGIAYNAGPGRLKQWLAKPHSSDIFEFIEDIPYDETKNYVKIGARNMLFYQRLAAPDAEINFPKDFVKKL